PRPVPRRARTTSSVYSHSRRRLHLHSFPTRRSSDLRGRTIPGSDEAAAAGRPVRRDLHPELTAPSADRTPAPAPGCGPCQIPARSEEHTSELQSRFELVCRLLLEKKKCYVEEVAMVG